MGLSHNYLTFHISSIASMRHIFASITLPNRDILLAGAVIDIELQPRQMNEKPENLI